jgi:hypothetical protein
LDRSKEEDVENLWKGLKDCLCEVVDQVCGRAKGPARHRETWWWNEETEKIVKEKRRLYKAWYKTGMDQEKKPILR